MTPQEFANAIHLISVENVSNSLLKMYENPPGRKPNEKLMKISKWVSSLDMNDRKILIDIIANAAELSAFNTLSVIDGVLAVEDTADKGDFELWYEKDGIRTLLNDPNMKPIHDLMPRVNSV